MTAPTGGRSVVPAIVGAGSPGAGSADLIVHRGARGWTVRDLGEGLPRPLPLERLLDAIVDAGAAPTWFGDAPVARRLARALERDDVVGPVWTIVGVAHRGSVMTEDIDGCRLLLDDLDLRILDVLDGPSSVADVVQRIADSSRPEGVESVAARLGGLVAAGRVQLLTTAGKGGVDADPIEWPDAAVMAHEATARLEVHEPPEVSSGRRQRAAEIGRLIYWNHAENKVVARVERFTGWRPQAPMRGITDTGLHDEPVADEAPSTSSEPITEQSAGSLPLVIDEPEPDAVAAVPMNDGMFGDPVHPDDSCDATRIPVYAIWHHEVGPQLSLGMLTAAARAFEGGRLTERFEIRRPEDAASFLADLATRSTPAVLLCSDYLWTLDQNLETARAGRSLAPELIVIHGGPSCPKYPEDAERFLSEHGDVAQVLVRGEGEATFCALLDAIGRGGPRIDRERFAGIAGISFRDPESGEVVRTDDRARSAQLEEFTSPYTTGEFDHIMWSSWVAALETNRGCPYSCTFCDWGSATNSRVRKFDLDRVKAEIEWIGQRSIQAVMITDANFGMLARDVEIAEHIADVRRRTGAPSYLVWTPAKNTTKHLLVILEVLMDAGIVSTMSLSMQTFDESTLKAIDRSNISSEHFLELAAEFRRRAIPLQADLMLGLPGQTVASFSDDLQVMFDQEILPRIWPVLNLPNSPMNAVAYRKAHGLVTDERRVVVSTSEISANDRQHMLRLRRLFIEVESYGVLRHILRWVQWDHGVRSIDMIHRILECTDAAPTRYPALTLLVRQFDLDAMPPIGWRLFYRQIGRFLADELGVDVDDPGLRTVLAVQEFLMPQPGRTFPATLELDHDYLAYYREATAGLGRTGDAGVPSAALAEFGPGMLVVAGDPLGLCTTGVQLVGDSRDELLHGDFWMMAVTAYELDSPLARWLPQVARSFPPRRSRRTRLEVVEAAS